MQYPNSTSQKLSAGNEELRLPSGLREINKSEMNEDSTKW